MLIFNCSCQFHKMEDCGFGLWLDRRAALSECGIIMQPLFFWCFVKVCLDAELCELCELCAVWGGEEMDWVTVLSSPLCLCSVTLPTCVSLINPKRAAWTWPGASSFPLLQRLLWLNLSRIWNVWPVTFLLECFFFYIFCQILFLNTQGGGYR